MARLSLLRFSFISFSHLKKNKFIFILNFAIFIAFFALTASVLSIYFENKIDKLESVIIKEETNHIVYNNWLNRAPKIINEINSILDLKYQTSNFTPLIKFLSDVPTQMKSTGWETLFSERDESFNYFHYYKGIAKFNFTAINSSLSDAVIVSTSGKDIKSIANERLKRNKLFVRYDKILSEYRYQRDSVNSINELSHTERRKYYAEYVKFQNKLKFILIEQRDFFFNYVLIYFSEKKENYKKKNSHYQNQISKLSDLEANLILLAFAIQLIIFLIAQFFELTFEHKKEKK